jgi:hypothetical protein
MSEEKYTVWIAQSNGEGTTFVTCVESDSSHGAKRIALCECSDAWGDEGDYPIDSLRVVGVAEGDVEIVEWND